jgi:signal transduction histidine kinase
MTRPKRHEDAVPRAVRRFLLGSVVALIALMGVTTVVGHRVAEERALDEARQRAGRLADTVGRLVTPALHRGDKGAEEAVAAVLRSRLDEGYLWRAKVWAPDGTVVWSDEAELVGKRYDLEPEDRALIGTREVHAELSELEAPENEAERRAGEMLEVYAGSFDAEGEPLLFEAYISTDDMEETENAFIRGFTPVALGGLMLFQLAILPLAVILVRRVERAEAARVRISVEASDLERRRIAEELHDGVVQDLAGVGFAMPGIRRALEAGSADEEVLRTVDRVRSVVQRDVGALRSMMIEVYPPDLENEGLLAAVEDLADAGRARGLQVEVYGGEQLRLPLDTGRLVYRVVREGLHNVLKHAGATVASVFIRQEADEVCVAVVDDGHGAADATDDPDSTRSLGLRLLDEAVTAAGGRLSFGPADEDPADEDADCLPADAADEARMGRRGARLEAVLPCGTGHRSRSDTLTGTARRRVRPWPRSV